MQLQTDNKENIGSLPKQTLKKTFKVPLTVSNLQQHGNNTYQSSGPDINSKTSSQLSNKGLNEDSGSLKLKNSHSKQKPTISLSKRQDKQEEKANKKLFRLKQAASDITQGQGHQEVPLFSNLDTSRKELATIINKNQNKLSESPMETGNSGNNSLLNGVQFQGRWTQEEHKKFVEGIKLFGKDWKKIEEYIGSRTCAQIRSHAQKYFNRLHKQGKKDFTYSSPRSEDSETAHSMTHHSENLNESSAIKNSTNRQLELIQQKFQKLDEEDLQFRLRNLIAERELIAKDLMSQTLTITEAGEKLVQLTNDIHALAMQAFANLKRMFFHLNQRYIRCVVDLCKRMIDERNLTQLICILLSQNVTVLPNSPQFTSLMQTFSPMTDKTRDHHIGMAQRVQSESERLSPEEHDLEMSDESNKDNSNSNQGQD